MFVLYIVMFLVFFGKGIQSPGPINTNCVAFQGHFILLDLSLLIY